MGLSDRVKSHFGFTKQSVNVSFAVPLELVLMLELIERSLIETLILSFNIERMHNLFFCFCCSCLGEKDLHLCFSITPGLSNKRKGDWEKYRTYHNTFV